MEHYGKKARFIYSKRDEFASRRPIEKAKIDCAKKLFQKLGQGRIVYDVVDDYDELLDKVMR